MTILKTVREEISTVLERDPAARSRLEVLLCYAGLHAVWAHRITHWLWEHGFLLLARLLSQWARLLTGIEIHPGAALGKRFFIDHGMGVVIGETARVGDDVTIYQGVTLGGTGRRNGKRHPTLRNNVVVGAGAQILGNITVGENSRVGAGSVVLTDVPDNSTIVGVPGHLIFRDSKRVVITDPKEIRDPLSDALADVARRLQELEAKVESHRHEAELVAEAQRPM
jgi:serine O-acetyltransferase